MNYKKRLYGLFKPTLLPAAILAGMASMTAQTDSSSETYTLDPFSVQGGGNGYTATNSISAARVRTLIKDTPVPINIITSAFIEDFGYSQVEDAVLADATITKRGGNESHFYESYVIRGFRSSLNLRNRIPYIGFTDTSMVDRIEIVKGPAAVLYGLSDPGGLVNIITKKPLAVRQDSVRFRTGSYNFLRGEFDTTGPIDEAGKFLYRVTGSYESQNSDLAGGWHRQTFVTPALTIHATENTKIDLEFTRQQRNHTFTRPRSPPFVGNGLAPAFSGWQPVALDYSTITDKDYAENRGNAFQVDLTHSFSDNIFLRVTAAETTKFTDMFNLVGCCTNAANEFTGASNVEIRDNDNTNYYVDFTAADVEIGNTFHTFIAGAQRDESEGVTEVYRMNGGSAALRAAMMDAVPSAPGGYPVTPYNTLTGEGRNPDGTVQMNITRQQAVSLPVMFRAAGVGGVSGTLGNAVPGWTESTSYFVMDQIKAMEGKLNILAGLRRDEIDSRGQSTSTSTSIQAGFTFEVSPGLNFYSLYSESFRPNGDRIDDQVDPPVVLTFDPSEGEGVDIGFKFELVKNTLSGSIAYFTIDRTNILQGNPAFPRPPGDPPAFLSGLENSTGVEVQLNYTPNDSTQFLLSYGHTDAEVKDSLVVGQTGLPLEQTAPDAVSVTGRHTFENGIFIGGTWLYRAGPIPQFSVPRREWAQQKGYSRGDAFVGYSTEIGERTHTFRANVSNISNGYFFDRTERLAKGREYFLTWGFDL